MKLFDSRLDRFSKHIENESFNKNTYVDLIINTIVTTIDTGNIQNLYYNLFPYVHSFTI